MMIITLGRVFIITVCQGESLRRQIIILFRDREAVYEWSGEASLFLIMPGGRQPRGGVPERAHFRETAPLARGGD
jgi:hypothetical protein